MEAAFILMVGRSIKKVDTTAGDRAQLKKVQRELGGKGVKRTTSTALKRMTEEDFGFEGELALLAIANYFQCPKTLRV
jgi:hypothetical protein